MRKFAYILIALAALCAVSCNHNKTRKALLPNISGKPGEIIVVINKGDWEGAPGTVLRDSLACDFPFLPQREPMYDLVNVAPSGFVSMFQVHRNIIINTKFKKISSCRATFITLRQIWRFKLYLEQ